MEILRIIILALSGLILFYASSMRLINPKKANFLQTYLADPKNKLENDADLLSETRGIGAVMFLGGIFILLGTIIAAFRQASFVVAIVIFGGVILGRLLSMRLDSSPNSKVIGGAFAEGLFGALNAFGLATLLL